MAELEQHSTAWNRAYWFRERNGKGHMGERDCPIRLRGYSEIVMGDLPPKLRKKIDSAFKRGYTLESRTNLPDALRFILHNNPIADTPIGYIGKTELEIFVPTMDDACDLVKEMKAVTVMTEVFKGDTIHTGMPCRGYHAVRANPRYRKGSNPADRSAHLKPCFTEVRPIIDEWLSKDAAIREAIANWAANDANVIRIPFDSHKERYSE